MFSAAGATQVEKDVCTLSATNIWYQCCFFTADCFIHSLIQKCIFVCLSISALLSVECLPFCREDMRAALKCCFASSVKTSASFCLRVSTRKFRVDLFTVTTLCFLACACLQLAFISVFSSDSYVRNLRATFLFCNSLYL